MADSKEAPRIWKESNGGLNFGLKLNAIAIVELLEDSNCLSILLNLRLSTDSRPILDRFLLTCWSIAFEALSFEFRSPSAESTHTHWLSPRQQRTVFSLNFLAFNSIFLYLIVRGIAIVQSRVSAARKNFRLSIDISIWERHFGRIQRERHFVSFQILNANSVLSQYRWAYLEYTDQPHTDSAYRFSMADSVYGQYRNRKGNALRAKRWGDRT